MTDKEIWKFSLQITRRLQGVSIPRGAEILSVQEQRGSVCLWALCDPDEPPVQRYFSIVGTGHKFDPRARKYLGTAQIGEFVWHVFEG